MSKGEQTRQFILERAAPIFNQRGYVGCALSDIMEATGLNKGGIYRHFESKEELAAEAFDYAWTFSSSKRRQNLDSILNHVDRLKQHVANFVTRSGLPGGCPLLNTAVDSDNGNPVLRERVCKALQGWQGLLRSILEDGMSAGTVSAEVDPVRVANRIIGGLEGAMLISRIEKNDQALQDTLEQLDHYLDTEVRQSHSKSNRKQKTSNIDTPMLF